MIESFLNNYSNNVFETSSKKCNKYCNSPRKLKLVYQLCNPQTLVDVLYGFERLVASIVYLDIKGSPDNNMLKSYFKARSRLFLF